MKKLFLVFMIIVLILFAVGAACDVIGKLIIDKDLIFLGQAIFAVVFISVISAAAIFGIFLAVAVLMEKDE